MKRTDVTRKRAGDALDAMVARVVMEWRLCKKTGEWLTSDGKPTGFTSTSLRHGCSRWKPSKDISHTWKALEATGCDGMAIINDDDGRWAAVWNGMQNVRQDVRRPLMTSYFIKDAAWCKSITEAICKGALLNHCED